MKLYIRIYLILLLITELCSASSINGRIIVEHNSDSSFTVKLQINNENGLNSLGGATLVVSFDTSSLYFPSEPAEGVDYLFHNFNGGNYSIATVTRPRAKKLKDMIWLNIELNIDNGGFPVAGNNEWTDLVTLNFTRKTNNTKNLLSWETNNRFWAVYDQNNKDFLSVGNFSNSPLNTNGGQFNPDGYELSQNYPNPFNPSTTIGFNLKEDGNVKLTVYNALGEEIETLINSHLTQGYHTVMFNKTYLPTGIYFYKLDVDKKYSEMKKMILLK